MISEYNGSFDLQEHAKEEEEENQRLENSFNMGLVQVWLAGRALYRLIPVVMTAKRREREKTGMRMGRRRRKDGLDMVLFNMVREELRGRVRRLKPDWNQSVIGGVVGGDDQLLAEALMIGQGFITVMRNKRVNSNSLKD
ncbi:hypothetical protein PPACK8108_LOCUS1451 [Phakopsora pachyrhizi]|uniref:Uncharacterized protein n=1 Tax=Phakopsora pachyrhizi TaxID=170000 RepID=A0AAV0AJW0_PHAPC|nr:hypothetical protein PPACK8108_LOCUS1451 [Phakopsora pachyrhizi]